VALPERLNTTLSENLITLLAHSDEHGKVVAQLCDPLLFEGEIKVLAERCIAYWQKHGQAPKFHTPDLIADILEDPKNKRAGTFRRLLDSMIGLAPHVNHKYVLEQLRVFTRLQKMKAVILRSAERIQTEQELAISDVEQMWSEILSTRDLAFDSGLTLIDIEKMIQYMDQRVSEFTCGIPVLNDNGIVPARKTVLMFLAPPGRGKTWFMIHVGKHALMARQKVLHLSLEVQEEQVLQRYYQSLFKVPRHETKGLTTTEIKLDATKKIEEIMQVDFTPEFDLSSDLAETELATRIEWMGTRANNLRIKAFPPRTVSVDHLRVYLDTLEAVEGFIPDILLVDSPYLLKTDPKNYRISLGRAYEELRAVAVDRNIAIVGTHQISREGARSKFIGSYHVAEDYSLIATSDFVLIYMCTELEAQCGLARLYVAKARDEADKFTVLLTQNYAIGQFAIENYFMPPDYLTWLQKQSEEEDEEPEEE